MSLPPFVPFPKISRLSRDIIVTEKIDGTNTQILITDEGDVVAGSRNKWITPTTDNYGFAKWVEANKAALLGLGPGSHFGEWWGNGIQRGYGLDKKRFSLFNVSRWAEATPPPACCYIVPVLYAGPFDMDAVLAELCQLHLLGSVAAPGFLNPEGVVVFHTASGTMFKKTLENDESYKGATNADSN